jgi:hypothetical protein
MFETLESRRMMSVSTTTTQEPLVTPTTTSAIDANAEKEALNALGALTNLVNSVIKSLADTLEKANRNAY